VSDAGSFSYAGLAEKQVKNEKTDAESSDYYSMYYNRKYQRSGPAFLKNVYRANDCPTRGAGLLVSKYIHTNSVTRQVKRFGLVETTSALIPSTICIQVMPTIWKKIQQVLTRR